MYHKDKILEIDLIDIVGGTVDFNNKYWKKYIIDGLDHNINHDLAYSMHILDNAEKETGIGYGHRFIWEQGMHIYAQNKQRGAAYFNGMTYEITKMANDYWATKSGSLRFR
ncbi:hypothetical protein [Methylobacterium sp. 22177]|uniref:hypothetical protein n=1 Tax=Methylobacterium sp. 22177 TaxID=3453885 RepID=UPI003F84D906